MGRERNEELINTLEVKEVARKKAIKATALIIIFSICLLIIVGCLTGGYKIYQIIPLLIGIIIIIIIGFVLFEKSFQESEKYILQEKFAEGCLSTLDLTRVIPIDEEEHREFILGLVNIAIFYAILDKESDCVRIYVKFNNEDKKRYLESLEKGELLEYYSIQEENEQEEKEASVE